MYFAQACNLRPPTGGVAPPDFPKAVITTPGWPVFHRERTSDQVTNLKLPITDIALTAVIDLYLAVTGF